MEQRSAGPRQPASADGGGLVRRDFPIACKAPEMINPHHIDQLENMADALDPPGKTFGCMGTPAIERVAPALACRAEEVGWHAGDDGGTAVGIELEKFRARPDFGALVGDEDRRIADDLDAACVGICAQFFPLPEKTPLGKLPEGDACSVLGASLPQGLRITMGQRRRPVGPVDALVYFSERHEEGIVFQPAGMVKTEVCIAHPADIAGSLRKACCRFLQPRHPPRHYSTKLHTRIAEAGIGQQVAFVKPPVLLQFNQVNQQQVTGKCRTAHVGRVARANATQRQDLP